MSASVPTGPKPGFNFAEFWASSTVTVASKSVWAVFLGVVTVGGVLINVTSAINGKLSKLDTLSADVSEIKADLKAQREDFNRHDKEEAKERGDIRSFITTSTANIEKDIRPQIQASEDRLNKKIDEVTARFTPQVPSEEQIQRARDAREATVKRNQLIEETAKKAEKIPEIDAKLNKILEGLEKRKD